MRGKSKIDSRWLLAVWLAFLPAPRAAEGNSAEPIVERLQKSYDATQDFVADFRQETEVKSLAKSLKSSGKLTFKRPAKMLWRYDEPKGQFVLADGKFLYFYQPEQNQVIKSPLKNAFRGDIPLSFLLGLGNLKKQFNASLQSTEENSYVLRLEPKGESGGFSDVRLAVNKSHSDIQWVSIRDASGNLTTIRFLAMKKGVGVSDSAFQLKLPDGADIVEMGQ
ncbi:MAG TPA: outer membrane lipoprotein carrier protein LolA [Candidatus Binatia bacterium]|nr:outer membrane lipoprotein carrier protein LolA [Candidatus Binatia bacterium]